MMSLRWDTTEILPNSSLGTSRVCRDFIITYISPQNFLWTMWVEVEYLKRGHSGNFGGSLIDLKYFNCKKINKK